MAGPSTRTGSDRRDLQPLREDVSIQGNVLAGFSKDHQVLMFVDWSDPDRGRAWLTELRPRLATNKAVTDFNTAFSAARVQAGGDPPDLAAVWTNISFTVAGMVSLAPAVVMSLRNAPVLDHDVALWLGHPGTPRRKLAIRATAGPTIGCSEGAVSASTPSCAFPRTCPPN
jgi:hypothetical protein